MGIGDASNRWTPDRAQAAAAMPHDTARTLVTDAVAQLSDHHRALLQRAYFHGWTTGQIAADLGMAEAGVKTQLHYALRTLQRSLRDMGVAL